MSALTAVQRGRTAAAKLMVDTATIRRPGGPPVFDPITGALTPSAGTVVFTGPCRLRQPTQLEAAQANFGEQQVTVMRYIACFPLDSTDARIGDLITFEESGDPDVLTRSFRITAVPVSTFTIYKGYSCESVET